MRQECEEKFLIKGVFLQNVMIASPASSEAESLEMKDDEPTIKIASYYSLAADEEEQHEEQEQHIENAFLPSVQQPSRPRTVNPRQSLEMKSNISKDLLDKLVENRNYCKLCPLKAKQDVFKTKGALKFHLRIKHFRWVTLHILSIFPEFLYAVTLKIK